jgi:hypothetical protein
MKRGRGRPKDALPMPERFWSKVEKTDGCWLWTASTFTQRGYGQFAVDGKARTTAHRIAWELTHGPIPKTVNGKPSVLMHSCDNRLCCNPAHLRVATQAENLKDMADKGRQRSVLGYRWRLEAGKRVFYRP